ncbi:MAG TPA: hypothetical protein VGO93_16800 [Candidatus Xenobia bacterium]
MKTPLAQAMRHMAEKAAQAKPQVTTVQGIDTTSDTQQNAQQAGRPFGYDGLQSVGGLVDSSISSKNLAITTGRLPSVLGQSPYISNSI